MTFSLESVPWLAAWVNVTLIDSLICYHRYVSDYPTFYGSDLPHSPTRDALRGDVASCVSRSSSFA